MSSMILKAAHVVGFRSIRDTQWVNLTPLTGIVGENESGKTSFLLAIASLSPDIKFGEKDKNVHALELDTLVEAEFELTDKEMLAIKKAVPKKFLDNKLILSKSQDNRYSAIVGGTSLFSGASTRVFKRVEVPEPATEWTSSLEQADKEADSQLSQKVSDNILHIAEDAVKTIANQVLETLTTRFGSPKAQFNHILKCIETLQQYKIITVEDAEHFQELYKDSLKQISPRNLSVEQIVANLIPTITYLDKYDVIRAHYTQEDLKKAGENSTILRLLQLAKIDLATAFEAQGPDRSKIEARARATIFGILSNDWRQKQVHLVFRIDEYAGKRHLDILVESDNSVPIELDRRSDGFQWFLSFYAAFNHSNPDLQNCIFLLDDPAVSLHARGQADAYQTFERLAQKGNSIIFTTHSPFLVDQRNLHRYKLAVNKESERKGSVLMSPLPDDGTPPIQPLLSAMGVPIGSGFVRKDILLVPEGPIDYFLWQAVLSCSSNPKTERIGLVPARNAGNVQLICSLCSGLKLPYIGLLDGDTQGQELTKKLDSEGTLHVLNIKRLDEFGAFRTAEEFFTLADYSKAAEIAHDLSAGDINLDKIPLPQETDYKKRMSAYFKKELKTSFSGLKTAEAMASLCDPVCTREKDRIKPSIDVDDLIEKLLSHVID